MPLQPELRTHRLRLRPFRMDDAPAVAGLCADRRIADTTLSVPHPYDENDARAWIATHREAWEAGRRADWAVTSSDGNTLVGAVGLILEPIHRRAELGYWIGVPHWGKGYATEAARAVVDFAFDGLGLHRVFATHFARNPASGRVMEKLGFRLEGRMPGHAWKWGKPEDLVMRGLVRAARPGTP